MTTTTTPPTHVYEKKLIERRLSGSYDGFRFSKDKTIDRCAIGKRSPCSDRVILLDAG